MEPHLQEYGAAFLRGFCVFLILSLVYRRIYKERIWSSHLFELVLKRVRLTVYLGIVGLSAYAFVGTVEQTVATAEATRWLLLSLLVVTAVTAVEGCIALIFDYLLGFQKQIEVPSIYRDLTRTVLYVPALLLFLKLVLGIPIDFLTGSFIISAVIGLALQESLGNFFSGIFLHGSNPFTRGDWVQLGPHEGQVERIDWRATSIRTANGNHVIMPNSQLAKMEITNYSAPSRLSARIVQVGVAYHHPPSKIKRILVDCALKTDSVEAQPLPIARLVNFDASSITYELKFWLTDFERYRDIQASVLEKVWYHFKREDIEIPFPIQTTIVTRPPRPSVEAENANVKLLRRIDFLRDFSEEDLHYLASRLKLVTYTAGEPIIRQGETGNSFYILREGQVQIQARDTDGTLFLTKDLHKGDFFGEISLLTGEPRSATVVAVDEAELLRLDKEAFRKIMEDNPRADELISTVLTRRHEYKQEQNASRAQAAESAGDDGQSGTRQVFLKKIRDFFSY